MNECRICRGPVGSFLSFGELPLGNAFLRTEDFAHEERFGLDLGYCLFCHLVQQITPPPVSSLARDYRNYKYIRVGAMLRSSLAELGMKLLEDFQLKGDSLVVDIGSNDGTLLASIKGRCRIVGVEPAFEISEMAKHAGVPTINDFFTERVAETILSKEGHANVITATQTLQHIPNLREFIQTVRMLLKPNGVFVVEGRYFADAVQEASFGTIYHEMIYYFTLGSLINLFNQLDMHVFKAELVNVYGGSLRTYAEKRECSNHVVDESVLRVLESEQKSSFDRYETYLNFAERVRQLKNELYNTIARIKDSGYSIAGYGAPSTSATLLNFSQLGRNFIDYIVDDSPLKQGLYTPGTHIPIVDSKTLVSQRPDYILLLAWRLKDEIVPKVKQYMRKGTKLIVPLPKVEVLE